MVTAVLDWRERLVCSKRGSRQMDVVDRDEAKVSFGMSDQLADDEQGAGGR
jgi:hypothetical protein